MSVVYACFPHAARDNVLRHLRELWGRLDSGNRTREKGSGCRHKGASGFVSVCRVKAAQAAGRVGEDDSSSRPRELVDMRVLSCASNRSSLYYRNTTSFEYTIPRIRPPSLCRLTNFVCPPTA